MIISLALSFIAIASGALLTYAWDEDAPLASRLCTGACIGFALLGLIGFVLALMIGLTSSTLAVTALLLATPALLLKDSKRRAGISADINQANLTSQSATSFFKDLMSAREESASLVSGVLRKDEQIASKVTQ